MPEMMRFYVNQSQDPQGLRMREMLHAQFACERMEAFSHLLLYALVLVGAVVWVVAVQPGLLPAWAAQLSEAGWGAVFVGLLIVIGRGHFYRKRAHLLAAESKPPDSRPSGNEPE
jgi:hypothetical protein